MQIMIQATKKVDSMVEGFMEEQKRLKKHKKKNIIIQITFEVIIKYNLFLTKKFKNNNNYNVNISK